MSYKILQLSPLSTRSMHVKIMIEGPWSVPPANFRQAQFLRSWMDYDSGIPFGRHAESAGFNWNALLGLLLAVGISAGSWAGIGLSLSRLLR
jgi:hypothetical protein